MTLTTGTKLQNGKYLVQAILSQSDFGLTYRARHTYLDQTVILQSLNEVTQERSDFSQLRQQFATGARQLAKYPANHPLRALDYFEENGFPFVVLQFVAEQTPKLSDWFTLPLEPPATATNGETAATNPPSELKAETKTETEATAETEAQIQTQAEIEPEPLPPQPLASDTVSPESAAPEQTVAPNPIFVSIPPIDPQTQPIPAHTTNGHSAPAKPRRKWRMPTALIVTAVVGASVGAGMGLAVRLQPRSESGEAALNLRHGLFTREQSFPSQSDWPISETPAPITSPNQVPEMPATSASPAFNSSITEVKPFPTQQYAPAPVAPTNPVPVTEPYSSESIAPSLAEPKTPNQNTPANNPAIETPRTSATINTAPPLAQPRVVPAAPAPVAPAPVAPEVPAPVIEAPTPAPAASDEVPVQKPKTLDQ